MSATREKVAEEVARRLVPNPEEALAKLLARAAAAAIESQAGEIVSRCLRANATSVHQEDPELLLLACKQAVVRRLIHGAPR